MYHIETVDIDAAKKTIDEMKKRTEDPTIKPLLDEAEAQTKNFLLGMILTSIETGLIQDIPERLDELKGKLYIAFATGFILGREK